MNHAQGPTASRSQEQVLRSGGVQLCTLCHNHCISTDPGPTLQGYCKHWLSQGFLKILF